jgi:hypothetical protein
MKTIVFLLSSILLLASCKSLQMAKSEVLELNYIKTSADNSCKQNHAVVVTAPNNISLSFLQFFCKTDEFSIAIDKMDLDLERWIYSGYSRDGKYYEIQFDKVNGANTVTIVSPESCEAIVLSENNMCI